MADGGLNAVLAENNVPGDSSLPGNFTNPFLNCNTPQDQPPFTSFDLDGDSTDDVLVYLLQKAGSPPEIRVAACALKGNATGELIAGLQYGSPTGAPGSSGDILEYSQ